MRAGLGLASGPGRRGYIGKGTLLHKLSLSNAVRGEDRRRLRDDVLRLWWDNLSALTLVDILKSQCN